MVKIVVVGRRVLKENFYICSFDLQICMMNSYSQNKSSYFSVYLKKTLTYCVEGVICHCNSIFYPSASALVFPLLHGSTGRSFKSIETTVDLRVECYIFHVNKCCIKIRYTVISALLLKTDKDKLDLKTH